MGIGRPVRAAARSERNPSPPQLSMEPGPNDLPRTEALKDTSARFMPYWHGTIAPAIASGQRVSVAAHGNSLRARVKDLDNIP